MLLDRGCTGEDQWIGIMDPLHPGSPGAGDCVVAFLIRAHPPCGGNARTVMSNRNSDGERSAQAAAHKQARARDAELAMAEYRAEGRAMAAKTERLRALRLAKVAGEAPQEAENGSKADKKKTDKKKKVDNKKGKGT
jgi:hypothetical protein